MKALHRLFYVHSLRTNVLLDRHTCWAYLTFVANSAPGKIGEATLAKSAQDIHENLVAYILATPFSIGDIVLWSFTAFAAILNTNFDCRVVTIGTIISEQQRRIVLLNESFRLFYGWKAKKPEASRLS